MKLEISASLNYRLSEPVDLMLQIEERRRLVKQQHFRSLSQRAGNHGPLPFPS